MIQMILRSLQRVTRKRNLGILQTRVLIMKNEVKSEQRRGCGRKKSFTKEKINLKEKLERNM